MFAMYLEPERWNNTYRTVHAGGDENEEYLEWNTALEAWKVEGCDDVVGQ